VGVGTDGSEMRTEHVDVEWDWYWNSDRDGLRDGDYDQQWQPMAD